MAPSSPCADTLTAYTFSTTTTSYPPIKHRSSQITPIDDNDDDQIVWSVSEGDISSALGGVATSDEEDLVVLTNPRSGLSTSLEGASLEQKTPVSATKLLEMQMSHLSLGSKAAAKAAKKNARKLKRAKKAAAAASSVQDTTPNLQRNIKSFARPVGGAYLLPKHADVRQAIAAIEHLGLGQRPIVDDLSEQQSVVSGDKTPTIYEEASTYISTFLSNPDARADDVCRLTLLQSLIIELGLATSSSLPPTLSAAKTFLKTHAFLNIREYIAVRGQGPEAVQSVMYPSRSALIKSIKKKRNATSIKWVKELGLQVLLVGYMH